MYCATWGLHWFWIVPVIFMILMFACAAIMFRRSGGWRWCTGNRAKWKPFGCRPETVLRNARRARDEGPTGAEDRGSTR